MIQVSERATSVLNELREAQDIPGTYGVRFYQQVDEDGSAAVAISLAQAPAQGDQVVMERELPVFVAPDVAAEISEAVLDVEGEAPRQRFVILTPSA
ncbi:MAG TPA: iron-sulfur cluster biosynthesis protein [Actinomycetota bacterium]|nr:iron-sulfur cluster biosynthesis protein [Actinomycetota bacterium]